MADCEGMSIAFSFKLCTYFIRSTIGIRIFKPCSIQRSKFRVQLHSLRFKVQGSKFNTHWFQGSEVLSESFHNPRLLLWHKVHNLTHEWRTWVWVCNRRKCTQARLEPRISIWHFVLRQTLRQKARVWEQPPPHPNSGVLMTTLHCMHFQLLSTSSTNYFTG